MAQGSFSATVSAWVTETKARMLAVRNEAAQRTVGIMQQPVSEGGNLPFKTGFLRASLVAVEGDALPPLGESPRRRGAFSWDAGQVALVLANAPLGAAVTCAYTARYARRLEYGFTGEDSLGRRYNQSGRAFVRLAAQQWQRTVAEVAAEAHGRSALRVYQGGA